MVTLRAVVLCTASSYAPAPPPRAYGVSARSTDRSASVNVRARRAPRSLVLRRASASQDDAGVEEEDGAPPEVRPSTTTCQRQGRPTSRSRRHVHAHYRGGLANPELTPHWLVQRPPRWLRPRICVYDAPEQLQFVHTPCMDS